MNKTYTASEQTRLDSWLAIQEPSQSRAHLQSLIKTNQVQVNDRFITKPSHQLQIGDQITVSFPEKAPLLSQNLPLEILYQDEDLLVINKTAGLVVHPHGDHTQDTLVNVLLHHYPKIKHAVYDSESAISQSRPGIVHRLDRGTSGALLIAKDQTSLRALSEQFKAHTVQKEYLALLYGHIPEPRTLQTTMRRKPFKRNLMGVSKEKEGREAITHFTPLAQFEAQHIAITLVQCHIETGRTHQIRVHAKFIGHPVLGDTLYTNKSATNLSQKLGIKRQLLHAYGLTFTQPRTGHILQITAPLPPDFAAILTKLGAPDSLNIQGL